MQVTVTGIQETFKNPHVMKSLAVRGRSECGRMITCDCQSDFACPSFDAAAVNRKNNFLGLRIVGRLGFRELTPFVALPALSVCGSFDVQWISV